MIKRNFMLALVMGAACAYGQNIDLPTEYINNTTLGGVNNLPPNVQGSPYANEEFALGKVFVKGQDPYNGLLRYNAYQDGIEMKTDKGVITLLKREYLSAEIDGNLYLIENYKNNGAIKKAYFIEKNKGKARLLLRQRKEFIEERQATSSYSKDQPAKFDDDLTYYLITEGNAGVEVRIKSKDILSALPDHQKEVEAFAKKNKNKMRTEEEVLQILAFYNSL
ncbi:hypothetical protein SAMN06265375_1055 [Muriicola jejuensis]|uniref:Uncharacterized protein n=1 Tax=Muriicola jejuensis TaxID=504488 RepID=A0A6P0UES6_9FLAO|nr:hypothetical protein [Muriicola jejuensis]NER11745.1 hypothetical protein [Muriicola jejuensis]SMP24794.1 hypothetical protein SAMN06265375_1055 [Muriicola jejuensis]